MATRTAGGAYVRVANTFTAPVAGTAMDPAAAEAFFDEFEAEITDSLCRSGKGGMLAHLIPDADDGYALGTTAKQWSDLFLASGAVINFNNGDVTLTHSANTFTAAGASSGYIFDASLKAHSGTALPAGGTAGAGLLVSSTANFGVFFGSGAPSLSAAKGSLYLRSDGSSTSSRAYVNTDGSTTWTAITTAA